MKRRLDSIILGGAMLFGGIAQSRADHVLRQVDELGDAIDAVEDHLQAAEAARAERATMPGMPLPTGYGLQIRGPEDESIVLPVCLPPGFELASMVLCPEFLQRDQPPPAAVAEARAPEPAAPAAPPAAAPAPVAAPALAASPAAVRERLSGTLQYVFGTTPDYSADETFGGAVDAEAPRPTRARGVETHHLA
jgi:outer membrane murein-binding lipoprotein Lpp